MLKSWLTRVVLVLISTSGLVQGANLLQNPSFESPAASVNTFFSAAVPHWFDWPSTYTTAYLYRPTASCPISGLFPVPDGAQSCHLGVPNYLSQISTGLIEANAIYRLSMDVFAYDGGRVRAFEMAISVMDQAAGLHAYLAGGAGQEARVTNTNVWTYGFDLYYNSYTNPVYNGKSIGVNVRDNGYGDWWIDNAKLVRLPVAFYNYPLTSSISLSEGSSFSYHYVMKEAPAETVTVTIIPYINGARLDLGSGAGANKVLTFNAGNWNVPQAVTVTAVSDGLSVGDVTAGIRHQIAGVDADGAYLPNLPAIQVVDIDAATGKTYTFNDPNQHAYADVVSTFPFNGSSSNLKSTTEATSGQYVAITANDASWWTTANPGASRQNLMWMRMQIAEDPAKAIGLSFTFIGNSTTAASNYKVYVRRANVDWAQNSAWVQCKYTGSSAASQDGVVYRVVDDRFGYPLSAFIDSSNCVEWCVYQTVSNFPLKVNQMKMKVCTVADIPQKYGYFTYDEPNAIPDVSPWTTLNWVSADTTQLQQCRAAGIKALVHVMPQFIGLGGALSPGYLTNWNIIVNQMAPYTDSIAGFLIMDEPYLAGVSYATLQTIASTIKATYPDKACMVNMDYISIDNGLTVPSNIEWVGFDRYVVNTPEVEFPLILGTLAKLKTLTTANQKIFLVPQGYKWDYAVTDAQIAEMNWDYYRMALGDPQIIGQLIFYYHDSKALPATLAAQQAIGSIAKFRYGCGLWGYLQSDFNKDCKVDMADLAAFIENWLKCTHPQDANCEHGVP